MPIMKSEGNVDSCPVTKETWKTRAELKKADCGGGTLYHCLTDNNGTKWEKCVEKTLILEGNCPVFTSDGFLDWKPCNISEASCPNSSYVSNEVYKYPFCFGDNTPRNRTSKDNPVQSFDGLSLDLFIGILVPLVLLVLAAAFLSIVIGLWRKRRLRTSQRVIEDMIATRPLLKGKTEEIKRRKVNEGVSKLIDENFKSIFLVGGIGNLTTSTARSILETYANRMQWKPKQYQFPEKLTGVNDKTIIFVCGWFGSWNDDLCSRYEAKEVCEQLSEFIKDTQSNIKVIIAMTSDAYSTYEDEFKKYGSLFCNKINLDDDELLKDYPKILEELKDSCSITNCKCQELKTEMLNEGNDKLIGIPLKVEVISKYHDAAELLESYIKNCDILTAMLEHLKTLEKNEKPIYEWIMYICLKGHFSRSESFDKDLVSNVKFEIKVSSFNDHIVQLRRYVRVWFWDPRNVSAYDAQYVFWHPFIYICAFHYLYNKDKSIIMNYCNVNAVLELVRPSSCIKKGTPSSYIEVPADDADVEPLRKRLRKLGLLNKYKDHPLLKDNEENDQ